MKTTTILSDLILKPQLMKEVKNMVTLMVTKKRDMGTDTAVTTGMRRKRDMVMVTVTDMDTAMVTGMVMDTVTVTVTMKALQSQMRSSTKQQCVNFRKLL